MSHEAARAARGSATVVLAGLVEQAARLAVTATLARRLGPEGFGAYALAITVALALGTLSSLGQQPAVVRYASPADGPPRQRAFAAALAIAVAGGLVAAFTVGFAAGPTPTGAALRAAAPAVALTGALYVVLGALRAAGDVSRAAMAHQLGLPLTMLALVWGWPGEVGAVGATRMHVASTGAALGLAVAMALPRVGLSAFGVADLRRHLRFGLPQGIAETLLRMAVWLDVIVLAALGPLEDVGAYRVAASIASLAALPVMAHHIAFSPIVATGLRSGRPEAVAVAAQDLGRWTVSLVGGPLVAIWIAPELVLWPFAEGYEGSGGVLRVLLAGQAVQMVCAAASPIVAMSGRPRLELVNAVCAVGIALGLHLLLVPRFGGMGAAVAGASGIGAWSLARTIEAGLILGRPVVDRAMPGLCALMIALAGAGYAFGGSAWTAGAAGLVFAAAAWRALPAAERARITRWGWLGRPAG